MTPQQIRALAIATVLVLGCAVMGRFETPEPPPAKPVMAVRPAERPPTQEELSWVAAHISAVWAEIELAYPVPAVHAQFLRVYQRLSKEEIRANISTEPNEASAFVMCASDFDASGVPRMTFYLGALRKIRGEVDPETYKDVLIQCMLHEAIHLEEQSMFDGSHTRAYFAGLEADAWCKTAERVLVPLREVGRVNTRDGAVTMALDIYDQVGANCDDPLWKAFGSFMSPENPEYDYADAP